MRVKLDAVIREFADIVLGPTLHTTHLDGTAHERTGPLGYTPRPPPKDRVHIPPAPCTHRRGFACSTCIAHKRYLGPLPEEPQTARLYKEEMRGHNLVRASCIVSLLVMLACGSHCDGEGGHAPTGDLPLWLASGQYPPDNIDMLPSTTANA